MKKRLTIISMFLSLLAFADYEDFSGQDLSGQIIGGSYKFANFNNTNLYGAVLSGDFSDAGFSDALINNANFLNANNLRYYQIAGSASYKNKDLSGVKIKCDMSKLDFIGFDLSGAVLHGKMSTVSFRGAIIKNTEFGCWEKFTSSPNDPIYETISTDQLYSTKSYQDGDLQGIKFFAEKRLVFYKYNFSSLNMKGASFSGGEFRNTSFANSDLSNAVFKSCRFLESVSFRGSILTGADFSRSTDLREVDFSGATINNANFQHNVVYYDPSDIGAITKEQIYSTKSYKEKNLSGIKLIGNINMSGWNLRGQNLMNSSLNLNGEQASMQNTDFSYADLRGADMERNNADGYIVRNTIMQDGGIHNFSMNSSSDNFSIRKYLLPEEGGEMISAKFIDDSVITGGAILTFENGSEVEIVDGKTLTVNDGSGIFVETDIDSSTTFHVESGAGITFSEGSVLTVSLNADLDMTDSFSITVMEWEDDSRISGINDFIAGETLLLLINGEAYADYWDFAMEDNQFVIHIGQIPEPAAVAVILGVLALALSIYRRRK